MNTVRIWMLGKLRIEDQMGRAVEFNSQRAQELFCCLLLNRRRSFPREVLADLLWGESDPSADVTKRMRQAIWHLQTLLSTLEEALQMPILQIDANWIQFNPKVQLWLDMEEFESIYERYQDVPGAALDDQAVAQLQEDVDLYQGELLENWYVDWCICERERLQIRYLAILDKLMDYYEAHDEYEKGIAHGLQILKHDQARECTHFRLMRLFCLAGDRTAALRQYARCTEALRKEFGVQPAEQTVALRKQIAEGSSWGAPMAQPRQQRDLVRRLEQLQVALTFIQTQVEQRAQVVH